MGLGNPSMRHLTALFKHTGNSDADNDFGGVKQGNDLLALHEDSFRFDSLCAINFGDNEMHVTHIARNIAMAYMYWETTRATIQPTTFFCNAK